MRMLWGDAPARFRETSARNDIFVVGVPQLWRTAARFGETNRTLSRDESHALGRRIARFEETNSTLWGDEKSRNSLKIKAFYS